ncbi:MAG: nucleoside hydrolase [Acidimicrobiia bacterium]|nr:nucleoside hydrolase [Acidimicrobiia bacterium]
MPGDEPIRLLVDCDPGIDDAIMLLLLAHHHRRGDLVLDAVTAVAGNVPLDKTTRNARFVLDRAGLVDVPVYSGAAQPLARRHTEQAVAFHGPDGLGGLYGPDHGGIDGGDAAVEIVRRARAGVDGRRPWLLATGALTNVAIALALEPALADLLEGVVVMGGAFGAPGGNWRPWAEYNFYFDPEAARRVCESTLPISIVPLDVTERVVITEADAEAIDRRQGPSQLAADLLTQSIENHRRQMHLDGCLMHDPLAAAALVDESILRWVPRVVDVCTEGELAGHSFARTAHHADRGRRESHVALYVDVDRARATILNALGGD